MYCSYDARKVVECLDQYGVEPTLDDLFSIERDVGQFYPNHIIQVVENVMKGGNAEQKLAKVELYGWAYFSKPVNSMLGARSAAIRSPGMVIPQDEWTLSVYRMAVTGFCLADFTMKELDLLVFDIKSMISTPLEFSNAKQACRDNRSIYYLHGVIRRTYQTTQGRVKEIQQQAAASQCNGWAPPEGFEKMDVVDRKILANDWLDRLNNLRISEALDK